MMHIHVSLRDRPVFQSSSQRNMSKVTFPNASTITLLSSTIITSAFQSRVPYTLKLENSLMDESVPLPSDRKHQENTKHLFFANMRKSIFQRQERQSALMSGSKTLQFFLMERKSACLALTKSPKNAFATGKDLHQEGFCQPRRQ